MNEESSASLISVIVISMITTILTVFLMLITVFYFGKDKTPENTALYKLVKNTINNLGNKLETTVNKMSQDSSSNSPTKSN